MNETKRPVRHDASVRQIDGLLLSRASVAFPGKSATPIVACPRRWENWGNEEALRAAARPNRLAYRGKQESRNDEGAQNCDKRTRTDIPRSSPFRLDVNDHAAEAGISARGETLPASRSGWWASVIAVAAPAGNERKPATPRRPIERRHCGPCWEADGGGGIRPGRGELAPRAAGSARTVAAASPPGSRCETTRERPGTASRNSCSNAVAWRWACSRLSRPSDLQVQLDPSPALCRRKCGCRGPRGRWRAASTRTVVVSSSLGDRGRLGVDDHVGAGEGSPAPRWPPRRTPRAPARNSWRGRPTG